VSLFRKTIVRYVDALGKRCKPGDPGARKVKKKSRKWYGYVAGKPVPLSANRQSAKEMLGRLVRAARRKLEGLAEPHDEHFRRPLAEHVDEFAAELIARGVKPKVARPVVRRVRRVLAACEFVMPADLSASRVQKFLGDLRQPGERVLAPEPPPEEKGFRPADVAKLLGVKVNSLPPLIKRYRLEATGNGKARRYPKATVQALLDRKAEGCSIQTANHYLAAVKQFTNWMTEDSRLPADPMARLARGNVKLDRRHDRRALPEDHLALILRTARDSQTAFRGLTGRDRWAVYLTAMSTGFRAGELAVLLPESFALDATPPTVGLPVALTKNKKGAEQPLSPETTQALREYLAGRPIGQPVWPGTWHERAAEMLQADLATAGIPYVVQGRDGPLYADFHALRHSYIALLDKSRATLKEAMQLARHSDPRLTMAVYGKANLDDLGAAAGRLPSLLNRPAAKTETARPAAPATTAPEEIPPTAVANGCSMVAHSDARRGAKVAEGGGTGPAEWPREGAAQAPEMPGDAACGTKLAEVEVTGDGGNRTHFQEFMRLLLDH
jgi:integrase